MNEDEIQDILQKIESELTGDPEQDAEIWDEWGERYRGQPGSEPLLAEIGRRIFSLYLEEEPDMPQKIFDDMVETADEDYEESCRLIDQGQYAEAIGKLLVLTEVIAAYPLPEDTIWMDFASYLDSLVFRDYYSEEIGEKEIGRHPMHPGRILYTCGSLLIEMNRAAEAVKPLEMLVSLDPVCPKYLFELSEAYKRVGNIRDAYDATLHALYCASNRDELARGYRGLAYCLAESGIYEDAVMLYMLSLRYRSSRQAEAEIVWIRKKKGIAADSYNDKSVLARCTELGIPVGITETVRNNMEMLGMLMPSDGDHK